MSWPGVHHPWSWHVGAWISCWTRSELELSQGSSGGVRLPANVGGAPLACFAVRHVYILVLPGCLATCGLARPPRGRATCSLCIEIARVPGSCGARPPRRRATCFILHHVVCGYIPATCVARWASVHHAVCVISAPRALPLAAPRYPVLPVWQSTGLPVCLATSLS